MARPGLTTHRKFRRLARALGSPLLARGALELLWDSCYESGEDYVGTAADLEELIGWTGSPGALAAALVDAGAPEGRGFVEPVDEGATPVCYRVHDLYDHVPAHVSKRLRRRSSDVGSRTADSVQRSASSGGRTASIDRRLSSAPQKEGTSTSVLDLSSTDQEQGEKNDLFPDRGTTDSALLLFPVVGRGAHAWPLTRELVSEWTEAFPGLDVLGEAKQALAWVRANDGRRKTAGGMKRFLVGWLTRSVNRGGSRRPEDRPFSDRELAAAREWYRRIGISLDREIPPQEHMANFIRKQRLQAAS